MESSDDRIQFREIEVFLCADDGDVVGCGVGRRRGGVVGAERLDGA